MENHRETTTPINLQKLLTPASDSHEFVCSKNKKMYASSYFYAPTHPTVEDQVELARRISNSLSDVKNMKSKGQSMYVNRKKRSVKWIHDGNGVEGEEEPPTPAHKDKVPLKCMMNPNGKVLDIHGIQALGEEVNISPVPSNPEKLFDIVRDLNNQRGRGAEIFAKRRKRSEKWVVDQDQPQTPGTPSAVKTPVYPKQGLNENASYPVLQTTNTASNDNKPFFNPFTVDFSLDSSGRAVTGRQESRCHGNGRECPHSHPPKVKKIYLREVAVGTADTDFPGESPRGPERSRRATFDGNYSNGVEPNYLESTVNYQQQQKLKQQQRSSRNGFGQAKQCANKIPLRPKLNWKAQNLGRENGQVIQQRGGGGVPSANSRNFEVKRAATSVERAKPRQIEGLAAEEEQKEDEYTPVPVRQLIQEFEKTCRPALQYKHISPKVIPIVQQCPIDNDLARFFETRNPPAEKFSRARYQGSNEPADYLEDPLEIRTQTRTRRNGTGNGYASTDDTDCTSEDEDDDDDEDDEDSESPLNSFSIIPPGSEGPGSSSVSNCDRDFLSLFSEELNRRRRSSTSQELENLYKNAQSKYLNTEQEVPLEAKSLLLSMVASQEDILDTIKHLRNTPVLDNLLAGSSPDCKFSDIYPNLPDAGKLYENESYKGPKIASFNNLTNYNTAPRGWDQSLTYYRPIKFEKPQEIVYSDF